MNILYLDTLFFVNFIFDYFTLLCSAKCSGAVIRRIPISFAAILGGIYACLTCLPGFLWLGSPLIKLAVGVLLCLISYGTETRFLPCCVCFLFMSALFGGIFSALSISVNGTAYIPFSGKVMVLTFALVYFLLSVFFRRLPQSRRQCTHQVTVRFRSQTVSFNALHDTGNTLYDPYTNIPILICNTGQLHPLFPEVPQLPSDPYTLFFLLSESEGCAGRISLIPYQTVDSQGFLAALRPDEVTVDNIPQELVIAFAHVSFSNQSTYQAIL